ncbi:MULTISPECIES: hypothetical protein [unclassified Methylosinus]|uniref:hypothetical protein n=1 Tax=unclassified Methylosinus TaxID=2624500 RepID=UPI00106603AF|nr:MULTISPECIES: hypothetical protein [unclassified Methylosinus]
MLVEGACGDGQICVALLDDFAQSRERAEQVGGDDDIVDRNIRSAQLVIGRKFLDPRQLVARKIKLDHHRRRVDRRRKSRRVGVQLLDIQEFDFFVTQEERVFGHAGRRAFRLVERRVKNDRNRA